MASICKEFPAPSVDNPSLLGQFSNTLADHYRAMFPAARGFTVELEDKAAKRSRSWEIRIFHGALGGAEISLVPSIAVPREISITVSKTSRFERFLIKCAVVLAMVFMAPFFLAGLFYARLGFVLLLGVPIYFILAAVLGMIAMAIGHFLSRFDHHLDDGIRQRVLNVAKELPLPSTLLRPEAPSTQAPAQQESLLALPRRSGPWSGLTGR